MTDVFRPQLEQMKIPTGSGTQAGSHLKPAPPPAIQEAPRPAHTRQTAFPSGGASRRSWVPGPPCSDQSTLTSSGLHRRLARHLASSRRRRQRFTFGGGGIPSASDLPPPVPPRPSSSPGWRPAARRRLLALLPPSRSISIHLSHQPFKSELAHTSAVTANHISL